MKGCRTFPWIHALLTMVILMPIAVSPAVCEAKPESGSGGSILDSLKDLGDSLKELGDVLKGKKTKEPDKKPAPKTAPKPEVKPEAKQGNKTAVPVKPTGKVYIAVTKDGAESASGLSSGDRLWAKSSTVKLDNVSDLPPMRLSPPMDINKLTQSQYNGAVTAAMEAMRELMGKLTPDEEAKFSAKWAPLFGFPTEESVSYLNKLNPLLSEFLSLRAAIATVSVEFDGAWEEAVLAAGYDSEEGVREALGLGAMQKDYLLSLQARMVQVCQAIQALGNPPDPIQAQQQARKRHHAAMNALTEMVPSVIVTPAKTNGKPNTPYSFTAKTQNISGAVSINWVFGDGSSAANATTSVKHTYTKEGNYTVRAMVYDAKKVKITEGTAQVTIGKSGTGVWVLEGKKVDKSLAAASADSHYRWEILDKSVESQHQYKGKLWSNYLFSWDEPVKQLAPGTKHSLNVNLKALAGASYLSSPTDKAEMLMSITHDPNGQNSIITSAYVQLSNFNVKNDSKNVDSEVAEFTVPSASNLSGRLKVTVLIEMAGQKIKTVYSYKLGSAGSSGTGAVVATTTPKTADKDEEESALKARQETVNFYKTNIMIIERHMAKDREELAKTSDPALRAALEFRILQGQSDLQAEKDLITSIETGRYVHTRTAFDDYAHAQFVQNIKENQQQIESFQRSSAALYRLAGMLPPGEAQDALDFVDKQLTLDARTKMDRGTVNKIASALSQKVEGYYQAEGAKSDEKAAWANLGMEAAENIKGAADTSMMLCSIFGGRPFNLAYQAATGYVEGGPVEAVLKTATYYSTPAYTAAEAYRGYQEGGVSGAVTRSAKAYVTAKTFEYGISKALGGAKPVPQKPTVKQQFELAKFKQARSDGESLVKDFQRAQSQMEAAARSGASAQDLTKLQVQLRDKAASINSSPHAKNFLKYKGDFHAQKAYNAHMKAVHADVEARFHDKMASQGWNKQQLKEFRNTSSAGSVGMDHDIGLDELARNALTRNGKRATVHQWQVDAQKSWDQAYKDTTKRSAGMSWENVTTSTHPESYRDLAWLGSDKTKVLSTWAQQSSDVTRYKAWHMQNDPSLSRMEALQEISRGAAKDISTKMQPLLNNAKPGSAAATESLRQAKTHWQKIQTTLEAFGNNTIDPISAERKIRELTGGKGIPEVVNDMGTVLEGLIRSSGTK